MPDARRARWLIPAALLAVGGCATTGSLMVSNLPVSDLRGQPHTTAQRGVHDPLQKTQLLYGEPVRVLKIEDGWANVEAIEQAEFTHARRWQGYPGWVPATALVPWNQLRSPTIVVTEKWASALVDAFTTRLSPWQFPLGTCLRATDMGGQLWRVELLDGTTVWLPHRAARSLAAVQAMPTL